MAAEITNIHHAIGIFRGDTPAWLAQLGFNAAITRVSAGLYRLTTEIALDFGEGVAHASAPAPFRATAAIIADGQIEIQTLVDGVPTDTTQISVWVYRFRIGEVAIPALPPGPAGAGLATALVGYGAGVTALQLNVRTPANGGDDILGDGSAAAPYATPQRAVQDVERTQGAAIIHMGSGTYTRPILRNLYGPVLFVGDGGGDAGDDGLTELQGATVAGAGTTSQFIDGVFGAGAFDGKAVEILDGAAAGFRRTISDTQVGGLVPLKDFSVAAPVPGDTFRIVEPAVIWENFTVAGAWISNCGAVNARQADTDSILNQEPLPFSEQAILLCNVMLDGGAGLGNQTIRDSNVELYGVEGFSGARLNIYNSQIFVGTNDVDNGRANTLSALLGLPSTDDFAGYGAFLDGPPNQVDYLLSRSTFTGYVQSPEHLLVGLGGALGAVMGGRVRSIIAQDTAHFIVKLQNTPLLQIGENATPIAVRAVAGGSVDLQHAGIVLAGTTDGIKVDQGGKVWAEGSLSATGTAGAAMNASQGGRGYLRGDPAGGTWVGGAGSFQVSAAEFAAVGAFAALDGTLVAAVGNGSVITRVL